MTACMGGWCHRRDTCARHKQDDQAIAAERLCGRRDLEWFVQWKPSNNTQPETAEDGQTAK